MKSLKTRLVCYFSRNTSRYLFKNFPRKTYTHLSPSLPTLPYLSNVTTYQSLFTTYISTPPNTYIHSYPTSPKTYYSLYPTHLYLPLLIYPYTTHPPTLHLTYETSTLNPLYICYGFQDLKTRLCAMEINNNFYVFIQHRGSKFHDIIVTTIRNWRTIHTFFAVKYFWAYDLILVTLRGWKDPKYNLFNGSHPRIPKRE